MARGKVELVCGCVESAQLTALLKGSVLPLAAELLALEEREGTLLALDDADAAQELVRVRQVHLSQHTSAYAYAYAYRRGAGARAPGAAAAASVFVLLY